MFGKYKIALANPRKSPLSCLAKPSGNKGVREPLTPLKKGGTRIKVPLFKGDLGGFTHYKRSNWTFQTSSKNQFKYAPRRSNNILQMCRSIGIWEY
jgi:hypothetical protein